MNSITIFNNLIVCNGFGARIALLLVVLVIVEGNTGSQFEFLGAAIKWKLNNNIHNSLEICQVMTFGF